MFGIAPPELPSRLQAVVEGFVDGILIVNESGDWIHANTTARQICHQLGRNPAQPNQAPLEIQRVCESLIESRSLFPQQKFVLESEVKTPAGAVLRIRAQWLEAEPSHYLLVVLEDRYQSLQNLAASHAKKYGLTDRQAQVWALRRAGHSYQEIAQRLYITQNTVKKHMKDIHAKILDVQEWEDYLSAQN